MPRVVELNDVACELGKSLKQVRHVWAKPYRIV